MKINNHNTTIVKQRAEILRIKLEIKSLYKKKQYLNMLTYQKHIEVTNIWKNIWPIIEKGVIQKLQDELSNIHLRQNNKIETLKKHTKNPVAQQNTHTFPFFHRVKNLSKIDFSEEEYSILNKGLQYNFGQNRKNLIENLALEAETAISHLHVSKQEHIRHLVANNLIT
jgi:hypothetical protein